MNEHGGNVYIDGQLREFQDMSANINALGLPQSVRTAILNSIDGIIHYPDVRAFALKMAIANHYGVDIENILTLNGAAEFFYLYFQTMRPKKVMIVSPTFSEYERAARSAGCEVQHFITSETEDFKLNVERLIGELTGEECVVICRPNNPTGTMISVENVIKIARHAASMIVDESFIDFMDDAESLRSKVSDKLTIVQSLTKIYAIPGLRLGFAVAEKSLIERLEHSKDVWNVNSIAQAAGVAALADAEYIKCTHEWLEAEIEYVTKRLQQMNIKFYESTVNFVLMKFEDCGAATEVSERLRRNGILVRNCANFLGLDDSYIRMAIRTRSENERALDIIDSEN